MHACMHAHLCAHAWIAAKADSREVELLQESDHLVILSSYAPYILLLSLPQTPTLI